MTLHWWMHWFWVTLLTIIIGSAVSLAAPQSDQLQHITTGVQDDTIEHFERQGRAMYFSKTSFTTTVKSTTPTSNSTTDEDTKVSNETIETTTQSSLNTTEAANATKTGIVHPSVVEENFNETSNSTIKSDHESTNTTDVKGPVTPHNKSIAAPNTKKRINLTRHPDIKELDRSIEGAAESSIVTEKTLSLETTFLQTRIPPNIESSRRVIDQPSNGGSGMDTGEIAGISFAALVLAALAGSTAFVLYRRRYLNKPQTLNDKCSNPDSSYLDDSTVRDNSEEMYSLDNDSFLNSLEAMTIQNYWTDTVKHTKL